MTTTNRMQEKDALKSENIMCNNQHKTISMEYKSVTSIAFFSPLIATYQCPECNKKINGYLEKSWSNPHGEFKKI